MSLLSNTGTLLGKELRTEFRSRELLTTTVVFILVVIVLFSFTFDPTATESRRFGPGLLWLAFLFAASLMLQPCFLREQNNDTLSALRLAVADPFDSTAATDGAARLLRRHLDHFHALRLAVAAYHAGPAAVTNGIPHNGMTPEYVARVMSAYARLHPRRALRN